MARMLSIRSVIPELLSAYAEVARERMVLPRDLFSAVQDYRVTKDRAFNKKRAEDGFTLITDTNPYGWGAR